MFFILTGCPQTGFHAFGPWATKEQARVSGKEIGEPEYLYPDWWILPIEPTGDCDKRSADEWRELRDVYLHVEGDMVEGWEFSGPFEGMEEDGVRTLWLSTGWC